MEFGEKNGLLAKEQYGSGKETSAVQHALNKRLVLDNIPLTKTPAVYCANDAKSCYDRIILMVAYLTLRRYGISEKTVKCTISVLMEMKHHIRTVHGDSKLYYVMEETNGKKKEAYSHMEMGKVTELVRLYGQRLALRY